MAKDETKRLRPAQIQLNKDHFANLQRITAYAPANPAYTTELIGASETQMNTDGAAEAQTLAAAAAAARDTAVASEWKHHNLMLGARDQVVAQFGRDSNEAQMVGLTKKSERKTPRSRTSGIGLYLNIHPLRMVLTRSPTILRRCLENILANDCRPTA